MCFGIDAGDSLPFTCRVGEIGVTAQAKLPTAVYVELFRVFRMVHCRSMAIFTRDNPMKFFSTYLNYRTMAGTTVFMHSFAAGNSVFCRLVLPLHFVRFTVKRVHKAPLTRSKVVRYIEEAKYQ